MSEWERSQEGQESLGTSQQRESAAPQPSVSEQLAICQAGVKTALRRLWSVGAVQKDQQFCLHLAARITLPEEINSVHEPRELSAWCQAAGKPLAAPTCRQCFPPAMHLRILPKTWSHLASNRAWAPTNGCPGMHFSNCFRTLSIFYRRTIRNTGAEVAWIQLSWHKLRWRQFDFNSHLHCRVPTHKHESHWAINNS